MESNIQYADLTGTELPPAVITKLQELQPGTFCFHRSWGTGKVQSWDVEASQMKIDFQGKPGHTMEFTYGAQSLQSLTPTHIQARLYANKEEVKKQAQEDPVALVQNVLQSFDKEATIEKMEKILVPTLFTPEEWKKWWEGTKKTLKKDARYHVPSRRTETIVFHETALNHQAGALEELKNAVGAKAQTTVLAKLQKVWTSDVDAQTVQEIVEIVNKTLAAMPKSQASAMVELILLRDEFIETAKLPEQTGDLTLSKLFPRDATSLVRLLEPLSAIRQAQALEKFRELFPTQWPETFLALLPSASGRIMDVILSSFTDEKREAELQAAMERLVRERNLTPDLLVWICKNRDDAMQSLMGPQLFSAILSVLEYDQLADYKKGTRLHDLLINDKTLARDLLSPGTDEDVRDITRGVLLTPVFEELNKRSLLATLVKLYPFVQNMIVGEHRRAASNATSSEGNSPLIVSWSSLEKRKAELDEIVNKKIPENTRDIATAREYGDLRENHEFKAAKEMQTVLMRRKAELEQMITVAQGTDFKNVTTDRVNIGTVVTLEEGGKTEKYTILGAWDSEPEKGIISYLTAVAKALSGKKVGAEVSLPQEDGKKRKVKIQSIEPYIK